MKTIIITTIITLLSSASIFSQITEDQNPNFKKSLEKYDLKKNMAAEQQSVTVQETYKVEDWRDVKAEQKELKAERRHELRKMRIERDAQNRRFNNRFNNRRYNRNVYPYNF
jgi:hypothetical protein